jgi:hypothetical protein
VRAHADLRPLAANCQYARYISFSVRDGYAFVISRLRYFLSPKFPQLLRPAKEQLFWYIGLLVEREAGDVEQLVMAALRQLKGALQCARAPRRAPPSGPPFRADKLRAMPRT